MEQMLKSIAAALRVLNPEGAQPRETARDEPANAARDNCDKRGDNRDTFPPGAT